MWGRRSARSWSCAAAVTWIIAVTTMSAKLTPAWPRTRACTGRHDLQYMRGCLGLALVLGRLGVPQGHRFPLCMSCTEPSNAVRSQT